MKDLKMTATAKENVLPFPSTQPNLADNNVASWSLFNDPKIIGTRVLAPGTYTIKVGKKLPEGISEGLTIEPSPDLEIPPKTYGKVPKQAHKILNTFFSRKVSTGVLLAGDKGSGKTMLAKFISRKAATEHNVVTIVIDQEIYGPEFNALMQSIKQPVVVLFDEFEKIYGSKAQGEMLTLFDGMASSHKLFILTVNEIRRINTYMQNRPGRIRYAIEFNGLEEDFIREYCEDCLNTKTFMTERGETKSHIDGVVAVSQFFGNFSFDMLKALVEEMNLYEETAEDAMAMLNMKPQEENGATYDIAVIRDGKPVVYGSMYPLTTERNPMTAEGMRISLYPPEYRQTFGNEKPLDPIPGMINVEEQYSLDVTKFRSDDTRDGVFVFGTNKPNTFIEFRRRPRNKISFNYGV